jgi:hypothetical protein
MEDSPLQRYRAEWLHKREIHKQQKRASKLAKLQAKESARNQRLLEGKLGVADRLKEWNRRRRLKKEKELEWLRKQTDFHPLILWLREGETKFFLLGACVLIAAFGYFIFLKQQHIRLLYRRLAGSQTVMVRVGDEDIRRGAFEKRMWNRHADREIQLETLLMILENATEPLDIHAKQYRSLEDEKRSEIKTLSEEVEFLEEKYLLSKITPAQKEKLFEEKKDELAVYNLSSVRFKDVPSAEQFVRAFLKGMSPDRAAETYSLDQRPQRMKPIMQGELESKLGVHEAQAVRRLERGRYTGPQPLEDGTFIVYRLDRVDSEFQEVGPAINSLFVKAGRAEIRKELVEGAEIESKQFTKEQLIQLKL